MRGFSFPRFFVQMSITGLLMLALVSVLAGEKDKTIEEIIVQAPITLERKAIHSVSDPTRKTEVVELKRQVFIGDLDLSQYADVVELESRIEEVAKASCKRLAEMFPLSDPRSKDAKRCVERAIESAVSEKEAAIAAAH